MFQHPNLLTQFKKLYEDTANTHAKNAQMSEEQFKKELAANFLIEIGMGIDKGLRQYRDPSVIQYLLSFQPNVNITNYKENNGRTPLSCFAEIGNVAIAKMLIDAGADVNLAQSQWTPLHYAIRSKNTDVARLILEKNPDLTVQITQYNHKSNPKESKNLVQFCEDWEAPEELKTLIQEAVNRSMMTVKPQK